MNIRLATFIDQQQVLDVLNEVTVNLLNKGIEQWDYPWNLSKIGNEIENKNLYVLQVDEKIIGTFCIKDIDHLSEIIIVSKSKYLYQVAILPEYQGKNIGSLLIDFACNYAIEMKKTIYLDCWAGNDKLKGFYLKNGFTYLGDFSEEDYFISIFKFN